MIERSGVRQQALLVFLAALAYFAFFHRSGFFIQDEGVLAYQALRVSRGQLPYADFQTAYTPAGYYLHALLFELFGPSLPLLRMAGAVTCALTAALLLIRIRPRLSSRRSPATWFLVGWLLIEIAGYFLLTPFPAARRLIGVTIATGILTARFASRVQRLKRRGRTPGWIVAFGIAPGVLVAILDIYDAYPEQILAAFEEADPDTLEGVLDDDSRDDDDDEPGAPPVDLATVINHARLGTMALEQAWSRALADEDTDALLARERPWAQNADCATSPDSRECGSGGRNLSFYSGHAAVTATGAGLLCAHHTQLSLYQSDLLDGGTCALAVLGTAPDPMGWGTPETDVLSHLPPGGRLVMLDDVGHFVHIEQPRRVADLVLEHLA